MSGVTIRFGAVHNGGSGVNGSFSNASSVALSETGEMLGQLDEVKTPAMPSAAPA